MCLRSLLGVMDEQRDLLERITADRLLEPNDVRACLAYAHAVLAGALTKSNAT